MNASSTSLYQIIPFLINPDYVRQKTVKGRGTNEADRKPLAGCSVIIKRTLSETGNQQAPAASIAAGSIIYFVMPEDRSGALLFNTTGKDLTGAFRNMCIKIQ
jgi:hypothetical protein